MLGLLRSALYRAIFGPPPPKMRLTFQDAKTLAADTAKAANIGQDVSTVIMTRLNGRPTWICSTSGTGTGWSVAVDDETGAVGPVKRRGVR